MPYTLHSLNLSFKHVEDMSSPVPVEITFAGTIQNYMFSTSTKDSFYFLFSNAYQIHLNYCWMHGGNITDHW